MRWAVCDPLPSSSAFSVVLVPALLFSAEGGGSHSASSRDAESLSFPADQGERQQVGLVPIEQLTVRPMGSGAHQFHCIDCHRAEIDESSLPGDNRSRGMVARVGAQRRGTRRPLVGSGTVRRRVRTCPLPPLPEPRFAVDLSMSATAG